MTVLLPCYAGMGRHHRHQLRLRRPQGWTAMFREEYSQVSFTGARGGRILVELLIEGFDISTVEIDLEKFSMARKEISEKQ